MRCRAISLCFFLVASVPYLSSSPNSGDQRIFLQLCALCLPPSSPLSTGLLLVIRLAKPFPNHAFHHSVPWPAYTLFPRLPSLQIELTQALPQRHFLDSQEVLCLPSAPRFSVSALRGFPAEFCHLLIVVFHLSWCVNSMKAKPTWVVFTLSFAEISPAPGIQ